MIAVCIKWVDAGTEPGDDRFAGVSAADQAALELALRHAAAVGDSVTVVTVGPAAAERGLRDAMACGASRAVRIDTSAALDSAAVAAALAGAIAGASFVWCGDYSPDRGSGSVPAFLAAELGASQALGAVAVEIHDAATPIDVTRRLDGGRRELLAVEAPAVISVEGSVTRLRRAALPALLAARTAPIEVRPATAAPAPAGVVRTYRPRARALAAPHGATALDRLRELTDAAAAPGRGEIVHLEPAAAAARIIEALRAWSYLP